MMARPFCWLLAGYWYLDLGRRNGYGLAYVDGSVFLGSGQEPCTRKCRIAVRLSMRRGLRRIQQWSYVRGRRCGAGETNVGALLRHSRR